MVRSSEEVEEVAKVEVESRKDSRRARLYSFSEERERGGGPVGWKS